MVKRMTVFLENSFHGDRCLQFPKAMSTIDHRQLGTNFVLEKLDKRRRARISWLTNLIDLIFYILRPLSHRWILVATTNRNSSHFLGDSIPSRWRVKELIFLVGKKSTKKTPREKKGSVLSLAGRRNILTISFVNKSIIWQDDIQIEKRGNDFSFAKLFFHRRLSCNRPSTMTTIIKRVVRDVSVSRAFCDSARGVKRSGDRQRIRRVAAEQKLQPREKGKEARRSGSSKGFFDGWLLKMLEERKGKKFDVVSFQRNWGNARRIKPD